MSPIFITALYVTSDPFDLKGKSSKFNPHAQKVGLGHLVQDEDVVSSEYHYSIKNLALANMSCSIHEVIVICSSVIVFWNLVSLSSKGIGGEGESNIFT